MAHTHHSLCYTVEVFIVRNDQVLLRMHEKYGIWCSVGGHIESGEDPIQAALREVAEEAGLPITIFGEGMGLLEQGHNDMPAPRFMLRHRLQDGHEHLVHVYVATTTEANPRPQDSEAPTEFHWFSHEDTQNPQFNLKPNIKHYAQEALRIVRDG